MRSSLARAFALSLFAYALAAQAPVAAVADDVIHPLALPKVGEVKPYHKVMQGVANPFKVEVPVFETIVFEQGSFTQLEFDQVVLTGGSRVELLSLLDGDSQVLDQSDVIHGVLRSAYFNGPAVRVRLLGAPQAPVPSLHLRAVAVGNGTWVNPLSICGTTDNRTLSAKAASARTLVTKSGGVYVCSAWLVSTNTGMATAGHCLDGATAMTTQFNVPNSTTGGAIVNPAATNQYPLASIRAFVNGGVGNDYGTYRTGLSSGLNPYQRQASRFTTIAPSVGVLHQRHGYGSATGVRNFAAKAHSGNVSSFSGSTVRYNTMDTTGGDSGSVVWRGSNQAVCVHTHGGCTSTGGSNAGTSVTLTAFANAIAGVQ